MTNAEVASNPLFIRENFVAVMLAKKAGTIMLHHFDRDQHVQTKQDGSPVTIADTRINDLVVEQIGRLFPDDGVIGEEASSDKTDQKRVWYCDPIDGTSAYVSGVPTAMFSLGLVVDNEPVLGVTYDPFLRRMFRAVAGEGAKLNGHPVHVNRLSLDAGIVAVTSRIATAERPHPEYLSTLATKGVTLALYSGAVHKSMGVASGRLTAYLEGGVGPHDMAASDIIIREAGGSITGLDGQPLDYRGGFQGAIVSNGLVHGEIVSLTERG